MSEAPAPAAPAPPAPKVKPQGTGYGWLIAAGIVGLLRAVTWIPLEIIALVGGRESAALMIVALVAAIALGVSAGFLFGRYRWAWWVSLVAGGFWLAFTMLPLVKLGLRAFGPAGMNVSSAMVGAIADLFCVVLGKGALRRADTDVVGGAPAHPTKG